MEFEEFEEFEDPRKQETDMIELILQRKYTELTSPRPKNLANKENERLGQRSEGNLEVHNT